MGGFGFSRLGGKGTEVAGLIFDPYIRPTRKEAINAVVNSLFIFGSILRSSSKNFPNYVTNSHQPVWLLAISRFFSHEHS